MIDGLIVVNKYLKSRFPNFKKKIYVISQPFAADCDPGFKKDLPQKELSLLTVSSFDYLEKAKGTIWLIRSLSAKWELFKDMGLEVKFEILGGGMFYYLVEEYCKKMNKLHGKNIFVPLGFVEDVKNHYEKAHFFLYNSTNDFQPNVLIEAMAYGLPVICNDFEPFCDLITENENGFIYSKGTIGSIVEKMLDLFKNKDVYMTISENNRSYIQKNFSLEAIAYDFKRMTDELRQV